MKNGPFDDNKDFEKWYEEYSEADYKFMHED